MVVPALYSDTGLDVLMRVNACTEPSHSVHCSPRAITIAPWAAPCVFWSEMVAIDLLRGSLTGSGVVDDGGFPGALGSLTAELHAALARPSAVISETGRDATPAEMRAMHDAGMRLLERAVSIRAVDQDTVVRRAVHLQRAIESCPTDKTRLGLIHGDLHIGQLVVWRHGLAVIDFDGPPEPTEPAGDFDTNVRDVAQSVCSLWTLAAVVDARTTGVHERRLRTWAALAETAFLDAYRQTSERVEHSSFDGRLLEALVAEQLCRELLYADRVLPRWRYAPLQALRWRYPPEA